MTIIKSTTLNSRLLKRKSEAGALREISPGIYTDNMLDPIVDVVKGELPTIAFLLGFSGRLAYGSGLSADMVNNQLIMVGERYRKWSAHGVDIIQRQNSENEANNDFLEEHSSGLKMPSLVRSIIENFAPQKSHKKKLLKNKAKLMLENEFKNASENDRLRLIQNLEGLSLKILPEAWPEIKLEIEKHRTVPISVKDIKVLKIMENLLNFIKMEHDWPQEKILSTTSLLFLECYFSNYIEGTRLAIEDAVELIKTRKAEKTHADGHDIVSLMNVMESDIREQKEWGTAEEWKSWMRVYHQEFLSHRPEKSPGEFKKIKNYAGSTEFTAPHLVESTLDSIFEMASELKDGWRRGCFLKAGFLLVHPFLDGNGRMGRLILNHCLSEVQESRLIVPNVYREDYLLGMKALSDGNVSVYARMMNKVRRLTATATVDAELDVCIDIWEKKGAFLDARDGKWGLQNEDSQKSKEVKRLRI